jgi:hypothetical protein
MNPTFRSKDLGRVLSLSEIEDLGTGDQKILYEELIEAVRSIDATIKEICDLEKRSGIRSDSDWLHRAKKKRRICLEFAAKLNVILGGAEPPKISYEDAYKKRLREILAEELGPDLERIESEAAELARADVGRD